MEKIRAALLLLIATVLPACGGGGGGGGAVGPAPLTYAGNTNSAIITAANASKLTADVIGGSDAASSIILGVSVESNNAAQDSGSGLVDVSRRLSRDFRDIAVRTQRMSSVLQAVLVQVDDTQLCDANNGTLRIFGPIDNVTRTGTVTFIFSNCLMTGVTLNGQGTMRIDAWDPGFTEITDFAMSFARLTLRATGLSVDAGGSLSFQTNIATNTETFTADLVVLDNSTGETGKTENFVTESVYDNIQFPTTFTANISGRVFDQVHGYVDITTPTLLVFGTLTQLFPDSGQMLLTGVPAGAGNRSARVTALAGPPATLVRLELDLDGDGIYEIDARLKWTDLSGPVGSDLDDDDFDLMHNSWETANGLNPNPGSNDAGFDNDVDGFTSLEEYLAGTDPNDFNSHP